MSTGHQIMDSSLALGRLDIKSPVLRSDSDYSDVNEKNVQDEPQSRLNGCLPLPHQVAGHKCGVGKVGILQHPDGTVLKQLQPPPRGCREMQFYSKVYGEQSTERCLQELKRYLPTYYGTWRPPDRPNDLYLKLEDVTRRFCRPCIMDVKIGQRSYDPLASPEKRAQQINKYPLMEEIGFLVLGMRVYQTSSDTYETYDQHYGRSLVKESLTDGLARFFHNGEGLRKDAVAASVGKVRDVLRWFEGQRRFHFYASSLLFVYEGDVAGRTRDAPGAGGGRGGASASDSHVRALSGTRAPAARDCGGGCGPVVSHGNPSGREDVAVQHQGPRVALEGGGPKGHGPPAGQGQAEVRMIDFAHVFQSETRDDSYIYGLKNLLSQLQQILDK
ncbi:inositol polyphosphate multikinase-like [Anguilla rostrata]|uniref:inositol polyphosphate multikinase-like n=1 Tax=Anguilla rostrata TaxID=7938 RepID=UPI0030CF8E9A